MLTPDLPLLQCRAMAQGEGTPGPLWPPLSSPRPERCESGWWVCPFCSWASGLLTFRPAAEPTHSWPLFGSALPLSCFPACERTWSHQAMAEHRLVLLRSLLSIGSQPWAVDNPNCPSSSPRSSWPSQPASASGPILAARHDQPHPLCSNIPPLDSLLLGWLSLLPCGHLGRQGEKWWQPWQGEQWWQPHCVDQGSPPLAYTSQGENPLLEKTSWVRHRACLPWSQSSGCTHTFSPVRQWVCSFPAVYPVRINLWFSLTVDCE